MFGALSINIDFIELSARVLPFDGNKSLWNLVKSIFTIWFVKWLSTKKNTLSTIDLLIPTDQVMCKHSIKIIKWIHFNWIELHVGVESIQFKSIQFDCSRNNTHGIQSTLVDLILFVLFVYVETFAANSIENIF